MNAVRYHQFGPSEVLQFEDVHRPVPGAGEVLVHVAATSFNPVDDHIRSGVLAEMIPITLPFVPGLDLAGTVAELGDGVIGFAVGDHVVAMLELGVAGAAAEYALAPAKSLVRVPKTVDLVDVAALPLTGLAAWQLLFDLAELKSGQTVLINGAAGAVGSVAVQLAVNAGATVVAVDDPRHADRLLAYGATQVHGPLDVSQDPREVGGPFDVLVNLVRVAPEIAEGLPRFVADGGIVVSSAGPLPEQPSRSVRSGNLWVRSDAGQLQELVALMDTGKLLVHVAERRALPELGAVHAAAAAGKLAGKIVLTAR